MSNPIFFAIGDIHGEADKLRALHAAILDRIAFERLPARIIHLGDYIDRGPDSRGVIDQILALEAMFEGSEKIKVISLRGNHEQMMLSAYDAGDAAEAGNWWFQGGAETADSYAHPDPADETWRTLVPKEHIAWLRSLPTIWREPDAGLAFVHAGIDPAAFPECDEEIRMWTRSEKFTDTARWPDRAELKDLIVVHGHTPQEAPEIEPHRINVDTGACYGGPLTAVLLKTNEKPSFLRAR